LLGASALDTVAGIRATIAGIKAQIKALEAIMERDPESDQIEAIRALLVQQRESEAQLALAEVDRRAAFFKLKAGTGDEILAAQAELRSAIDKRDTIFLLGGKNLQEGYDAELAVMVARKNLADLARKQADLQRRLNSDLTDSLAQALLDVVAAQQELLGATGTIEKLEAEKALVDAESQAKSEFYNRQLDDLDFLYQTDQLSRSRYVAALRGLQAGIDRTTRQGEELWRQIELQIRGLSEQASDLAFNIPTNIKLPTLFEVRRALEADALGVNYLDNRQQNITVAVSNELDLRQVLKAIEDIYGGAVDVAAARQARGAAGITIGGFN
ncbi:hypothetical protein IH601_03380, partial [Candidatus Bipolaricaulota bacterium]|nr:hypothetical protein [Candidatus Bipolaricaulota bacterium]